MDANRVTQLIGMALEEDLGDRGDITARACIPAGREGQARIEARQAGVVCGLQILQQVFERVAGERPLSVIHLVKDGDAVQPMQRLVEIRGSLAAILEAERTALNFFQRLSGIASATAELVACAGEGGTRVLDTRKTLPGWRSLDKYAVACGGGHNHRQGLYDMFLIKENHIRGAGGIAQAVERARELRGREGLDCRIEIEVESLDELEQALAARAEIVMLDNFAPRDVDRAVEHAAGRAQLEVSGGITKESLASYARRGVDFISVGALTHSVRAFDCSLLVEEVQA